MAPTSAPTLAQPITYPGGASSNNQPSDVYDEFESTLDSALSQRSRSDTIGSTSSSSSFPQVQTPVTPSILAVLNSAEMPAFPTIGRKLSYGFETAVNPDVSDNGRGMRLRLDTGGSEASSILPNMDLGESSQLTLQASPAPMQVSESMDYFSLHSPITTDPGEAAPVMIRDRIAESITPSSAFTLPEPPLIESTEPKGKGLLKAAVRRRIERSKSSIRSITAKRDDKATELEDDAVPARKGKLRSFLSLSSRSQSVISIRSVNSGASVPVQQDRVQAPEHLDDDTVYMETRKGKGKSLLYSRNTARPILFSSPTEAQGPPTTRVAINRAATAPLTLPCQKPKVDLFGTMLPRELKLMVLQSLVQLHSETIGNRRWDGQAGGRRALIVLSRVSSVDFKRICS